MDFTIPKGLQDDLKRFEGFLDEHLDPHVGVWVRDEVIPRSFFEALGEAGWLGFDAGGDGIAEQSALKQVLLFEALGRRSPGVAVAYLVQISLGSLGGTIALGFILILGWRGKLPGARAKRLAPQPLPVAGETLEDIPATRSPGRNDE